MPKYKDYVKKMLEDNEEIINEFKKIHRQYELEPDTYQEDFNRAGKVVQSLIREYENRLCRDTERGMYSKFSTALAEKFQNEVRKIFPKVDDIGVIVETSNTKVFNIKKIKLKN